MNSPQPPSTKHGAIPTGLQMPSIRRAEPTGYPTPIPRPTPISHNG